MLQPLTLFAVTHGASREWKFAIIQKSPAEEWPVRASNYNTHSAPRCLRAAEGGGEAGAHLKLGAWLACSFGGGK